MEYKLEQVVKNLYLKTINLFIIFQKMKEILKLQKYSLEPGVKHGALYQLRNQNEEK